MSIASSDPQEEDEREPLSRPVNAVVGGGGTELIGIVHPGQNDVKFGRGGDTNYHLGNARFRHLAAKYRDRYLAASAKEQRQEIVYEIIQKWRSQDPPGRFVTRDDPSDRKTSKWHDVGDKVAARKTVKVLGEGLGEKRKRQSSDTLCSGDSSTSESNPKQRRSSIGEQRRQSVGSAVEACEAAAVSELSRFGSFNQIMRSGHPTSVARANPQPSVASSSAGHNAWTAAAPTGGPETWLLPVQAQQQLLPQPTQQQLLQFNIMCDGGSRKISSESNSASSLATASTMNNPTSNINTHLFPQQQFPGNRGPSSTPQDNSTMMGFATAAAAASAQNNNTFEAASDFSSGNNEGFGACFLMEHNQNRQAAGQQGMEHQLPVAAVLTHVFDSSPDEDFGGADSDLDDLAWPYFVKR